MTRPRLEVAEVFRQHGDAFLERYGDMLSSEQRRALQRHRRLPDRGAGRSRRGLRPVRASADRLQLVPQPPLPQVPGHRRGAVDGGPGSGAACPSSTSMWFLRFPSALGPIALQNPREVYGLLFRAAAETLQQIAADPKHLGAEIGFLAVLHTWGQNLQHHPHVHCVVPGGGLAPDGSRWIACRPGFFLPVRVLSRVFRGKFLALLRSAFDRGRLSFHGKLAALADPREFQRQLAASAQTEWVVYAKPPWGGPEQVLKYLARYTHRVAISNQRLVDLEDGEVTFHWKDYAHEGATKTMTLKAIEFIRRFLLHVLPSCFVRIRHYGFLANRVRQEKLALCRSLLDRRNNARADLRLRQRRPSRDRAATNVCPSCGKGRMVIVETFGRRDPSKSGGVAPPSEPGRIRYVLNPPDSEETNRSGSPASRPPLRR